MANGGRAAIYTRVSSEGQATEERVSLAEQSRDIEAYAAERGYDVTHRYTDIESGYPEPGRGSARCRPAPGPEPSTSSSGGGLTGWHGQAARWATYWTP